MKLCLSIEGMSCSMCVQHVQRAILACPGVTSCSVELEPPTAVIECADGTSLEAIAMALDEEGYTGSVVSQS